jgi:hypothetical protein
MPSEVGRVPTFRYCRPYTRTEGGNVASLLRAVGKPPDPWQEDDLNDILAVGDDGLWMNFETGEIVGRQNGKGGTIEGIELGGIFIFDERVILHSSHHMKTSAEAFLRMLELVQSHPDFDKRIVKVDRSKGEEGITFRIGGTTSTSWRHLARLRYLARSMGSGRGLTGQRVVADEFQIMADGAVSALMETMATAPNPQMNFFGSAGSRSFPTESEVLASVRKRARLAARMAARGIDPGESLCFREWNASDLPGWEDDRERMRLDPAVWERVNPAYGGRIGKRFIQNSLKAYARDPGGFDRERLGVGDYPAIEDGWSLFKEAEWTALGDPASEPTGRIVIAVAATPDRARASVGIAGWRDDKLAHVELIQGGTGTSWIAEYVAGVCSRQKVWCIVVPPSDASATVVAELRALGVRRPIVEPTRTTRAVWCGAMVQAIRETRAIRHTGKQRGLNEGMSLLTKRTTAGSSLWVYELPEEGVDNTPGVAVTDAYGALVTKAWRKVGKKQGSGRPRVGSAG